MRYFSFYSYLIALVLVGCKPEPSPTGTSLAPSPAEQLTALGQLAKNAHPEITISGGITGSQVKFNAQYAPLKNTLTYELTNPESSERIVVGPEDAIRSTPNGSDLVVNRDSFMPNGKDWPYGSRMVAPFLDAIDGYSATLNSFFIENTTPPTDVTDSEQLTWFSLTLNKDQAHDLLLLEISKVSELKIGIDPKTGLLKSLYSLPNKGDLIPTEIRSH